MPLRQTRVGPRNHVIHWVQIPHIGGHVPINCPLKNVALFGCAWDHRRGAVCDGDAGCIATGACLYQSCPWVRLTHGLGWIEIFQFLLGWVASRIGLSASKVEATEPVRWGLHASLLSCCWGHSKHLSEELLFELHSDTLFNMYNDQQRTWISWGWVD